MESQLACARTVLKDMMNEYSSRRAYWYIIRSLDSDPFSLCTLFGVDSDVLDSALLAAGFITGGKFQRDKFKEWVQDIEHVEYDIANISIYNKKDVHVLRVGGFKDDFKFCA